MPRADRTRLARIAIERAVHEGDLINTTTQLVRSLPPGGDPLLVEGYAMHAAGALLEWAALKDAGVPDTKVSEADVAYRPGDHDTTRRNTRDRLASALAGAWWAATGEDPKRNTWGGRRDAFARWLEAVLAGSGISAEMLMHKGRRG